MIVCLYFAYCCIFSDDQTSFPAIDAIVVGFEVQNKYLAKKPSWTRKIVLVTDGESPMEIEDWDSIADKLNDKEIHLTIVSVL